MRIRFEERRGGHDLARLAETALRDAEVDPGLLARVQLAAVVRQSLDGGDPGETGHADVDGAGSRRNAVEMNSTGAALRDTATELRALESQNVSQSPEQRHVAVDVDRVPLAVDVELKHRHGKPPQNLSRSSART